MAALESSVELVRELQQAGSNLARLSAYMSIGVLPSRENLLKAQTWFQDTSEQLEPVLRAAEVDQVVNRSRNAMKG